MRSLKTALARFRRDQERRDGAGVGLRALRVLSPSFPSPPRATPDLSATPLIWHETCPNHFPRRMRKRALLKEKQKFFTTAKYRGCCYLKGSFRRKILVRGAYVMIDGKQPTCTSSGLLRPAAGVEGVFSREAGSDNAEIHLTVTTVHHR